MNRVVPIFGVPDRPRMRAWIEIFFRSEVSAPILDRPRMRAWIEIFCVGVAVCVLP